MKILIAILISSFAFAKMEKKSVFAKEKLSCSARELQRRDCAMESGKLKVDLFHGKWRFADSVTMAVHDLPTGETDVEWKSVYLHVKNGHRLIEYTAWSPPAGEGEVQTLTWYVIEVLEREPKVHVAEVVQRRHLTPSREPASAKNPPKLKYDVDPLEKHGLKFNKDTIEWHARRLKGSI